MVNMIRKTRISIIGSKGILYEIYNNVKQYIYEPMAKECEYDGICNLQVILDDETSQGYQYLMEASEKHHLHPHIDQWVKYTRSEIGKADYFQMWIHYPLELEGTDASDYGTQYEGGCPNPTCRLGKRLIGDVLVDRKFMRRAGDIGSLLPDIYVSEKLKDLISSNHLSGVSFEHEVKDYKGRDMPKFYVMEVHHVLSPMASSAWLEPDIGHKWYKDCGHNVVYLRSDLQYKREKLEGVLDFNLSAEYIDNYRLQEIVVSAKVRNLCLQHKINVRFFPIAIL